MERNVNDWEYFVKRSKFFRFIGFLGVILTVLIDFVVLIVQFSVIIPGECLESVMVVI